MKTLMRLLAIALVSFATLPACGGGGGGGGGGGTTPPTTPLSNGDVLIDDLIYGTPPATVFTGFEFTATGGFSVGPSMNMALFDNGDAKTLGIVALYHSGSFAWHILYGTSATVTFDTPPSTLSFWVRTVNAADVSTIEIFDVNSVLIPPVVTPTTVYQQIVVTIPPGQPLIGSMVVTNPL